MEFFKIRKDIPFMRHALMFNVFSLITFLLAVGFSGNQGTELRGGFHRRYRARSELPRRRSATGSRHAGHGRL